VKSLCEVKKASLKTIFLSRHGICPEKQFFWREYQVSDYLGLVGQNVL
jgi:hypothetical protein